MAVKFYDLKMAHEALRPELDSAWRRVLESGHFILGEEVEAFEARFAKYCGARHCIGVGSGLEALSLSLRALGVEPGDEVIVPTHTFIATWLAVMEVGAKVVPVEPDESTFNLDPNRLERAITDRTRVIVPVHLYGQPAEMTAIRQIAERHGVAILEDAAQAHGARWGGSFAGSLGAAAAFSFYPTKNLGALGDAGAVLTNDLRLAAKLRQLRNYGSERKYEHDIYGVNSRLDPLQAAVLSAKLPVLDDWNNRRRSIAARYTEGLRGLEHVELPRVCEGAQPVWHLYVIRSAHRAALQARLEALGIGTLVHYPTPPHLQGASATLGFKRGDFPIAERLAAQVLSLPMWPQMSDQEVQEVIGAVREAAQGLPS